jgi:hypothetical protein
MDPDEETWGGRRSVTWQRNASFETASRIQGSRRRLYIELYEGLRFQRETKHNSSIHNLNNSLNLLRIFLSLHHGRGLKRVCSY